MPNPIPPWKITTRYGTPGEWAAGYHTGVDYATGGQTGYPVRATRPGRVVSVGNAWGSAYGLHVVLEGRRGRIRAGYCHLSWIRLHVGDEVLAGTVIGDSGNTGRSTGPHLHYEERRAPFTYGDDRAPRWQRGRWPWEEEPGAALGRAPGRRG
jgi:murein DD-endopeptidase MepM/ murein hydrolase activator NlpD